MLFFKPKKEKLEEQIRKTARHLRKATVIQIGIKEKIVNGFYGAGNGGMQYNRLKSELAKISQEIRGRNEKLNTLIDKAATYGFAQEKLSGIEGLKEWALDLQPSKFGPKGLYMSITTYK